VNEKYTTNHQFISLSDKAEPEVLKIKEVAEEQAFFLYRVSCDIPYYGKSVQHKFEV